MSISLLGRLDSASSRLAAQARELMDVPLELSPRARRRHAHILELSSGAPTALTVSANVPMELEQLGEVRRCALSLDAIIFDGWGFYDCQGRALLVRSGAFDPAARFIEARGRQ